MKITKYFLSMAAAVGMIAACQKAEIVQIAAPEDVVAPVLAEIEGPIEITAASMASDSVKFSWSAADFGVKTQVNYSIEVAAAAAPEAKVTVTSGLTVTETVVSYETLNAILYNDLKLADGIAEDIVFNVAAQVGVYAPVYSNAVTVSAKVTAAEKEYPKMTVVGNYQGWSPGKGQFVFDFAGDDKVYQGLIDFGADGFDYTTLEFKITGTDWGAANGEHSVPEGTEVEPEAKTIALVNGGGSNITAYRAKRFYHLTFDKSAPSLTADVSFDQIGVIGDFNNWGADVVMNFNASKQRFYADVEFPADGGFKFRLDGGWDVSYGSKTEGFLDSGDNIPVKAGNYRVYLNMNNFGEMTYSLDAKMFGKDEPVAGTTPEPEPEPTPEVQGWGLVGAFNKWGESADIMLTAEGDYLVAKAVELEGELKFRKDAKWDTDFGLADDVAFAANTELALKNGGANLNVEKGTYDVYLDEANAKAWFITDGSYPGGGAAPVESEWGFIGSLAACNNWANNVKLYVEGDYSVAKGVVFADGDQFKFRKGETWGTELTYEGAITIDAKLDLIDGAGGKQNSSIAKGGTYDVYLANDLSCYYVMTPGKTPAEAGEAEKVIVDYSNCQMELVGSGVKEQTGTAPDTAWSWGNVLLASNDGKPAKEGDVYTWTWSNVQLSAEGWKVRVLNAAESGGVASFDLGDGQVDKTASPNVQTSSDGNIYVTEGTYNITLVIDAAAGTKVVTVVSK